MFFSQIPLFGKYFIGLFIFRHSWIILLNHPEKTDRKIIEMICTQFRFFLLILLFILVLSGCNVQVRYPSEFPSKTIITNEETFWFWGLIGEKNYEVNDLCPHGRVYEVKIYNTILQSTYTIISLGIYSPRTVTIVCSIREE